MNELSRGVKVGGEGEGERGGAAERIPAGRQRQPRGPGGGRRWQRGSLAIPRANAGPPPAASSDSRRAAPGRSRGRAAIQPSRRRGPSPPLARPSLRAPASGQGPPRPRRFPARLGACRPCGASRRLGRSAWSARTPRLPSALHRLRGHPCVPAWPVLLQRAAVLSDAEPPACEGVTSSCGSGTASYNHGVFEGKKLKVI